MEREKSAMSDVAPRRIMLLITDSNFGGTEKVVSLLARNLDRRRFNPVVCSVKPPGVMAGEVRKAGVEFLSLGLSGGGVGGAAASLLLVGRLSREIRKRRIDLVHSFLFLANMIGRLACRRVGVPIISSIRVEEREKGWHLLLERLTSGLTDRYLAPSEQVALFTEKRAGIPRSRITVIPNPVEELRRGAPRLRPLLGIGREETLIGVVGRLHRQKGIDVLIEALSLIPPGDRPLLAVVGDGPDRAVLEREAERRGVLDRLRFTGFLPRGAEVVGELDLLVLPSRWEGLPNTVLEAMAAGVPVVAAAVGGVPEILEDGITGFLVPPENPEALADTLRRALASPVEAEAAAAKARETVSRFSPQAIAERFGDLYDTILGGEDPSG